MIQDFFASNVHGSFISDEFIIGKELFPHDSLVSGKWKEISFADKKLVDKAIESAEKGLYKLKSSSAYERAHILKKMAQLLREYKGDLAKLISNEMGKTLREAKAEIDYAANYFEWFAEEAKRIYGQIIPSTTRGKVLQVIYEPVGIVAVITPWNYPIAMGARKFGPAIAAGCSTIVRPSTSTCVSMLAMGAIAEEAGLPKDVLNIVIGNSEMIANKLLSDNRVRKLTFTGSTETGKKLYSQSVSTLKKVTLELGGHAPLIVFEDADLDSAARESVSAKLRVSGQTCVCPNRFFIHEKLLEPYLKKVIELIQQMKIGSPLDEKSDLTNKLHPTSYAKVQSHIENALAKGAEARLKGKELFAPTILTGINEEMRLYCEETFGPVFPLTTFKTEEEVVERANDTLYGLASYIFTRDINRAHRVTSNLQYGIVGLNDGRPSAAQIPFGGIKHSGFGREGGPRGIFEYLHEKTISLKT